MGLCRSVAAAPPDEAGIYTYWDYRARNPIERGIGWRIDHLMATAPLAARSRGSGWTSRPAGRNGLPITPCWWANSNVDRAGYLCTQIPARPRREQRHDPLVAGDEFAQVGLIVGAHAFLAAAQALHGERDEQVAGGDLLK